MKLHIHGPDNPSSRGLCFFSLPFVTKQLLQLEQIAKPPNFESGLIW